MAKVTVSFTLDSEQDRDLARWLDGLPKRGRSEAIRDALRAHLGQGSITLGDIYAAIMELKRQIATQSDHIPTNEEPPDLAAVLDNLGL
jgi:metal-responsive CopG/Arc/MetJ family transcriptional regulator